jgi:hypothetical protein
MARHRPISPDPTTCRRPPYRGSARALSPWFPARSRWPLRKKALMSPPLPFSSPELRSCHLSGSRPSPSRSVTPAGAFLHFVVGATGTLRLPASDPDRQRPLCVINTGVPRSSAADAAFCTRGSVAAALPRRKPSLRARGLVPSAIGATTTAASPSKLETDWLALCRRFDLDYGAPF